jgi:catechol 2,3-dioxygenase-like lactoylglutathione lyase family enzyme
MTLKCMSGGQRTGGTLPSCSSMPQFKRRHNRFELRDHVASSLTTASESCGVGPGTVPCMLQHVTLEIDRDRVEACVRFWGLLGFEPMVAPPLLRDRFVWVAREGTQIHLMPIDDPIVPDQGHTAVLPPDYEAALAALRDAGFELRAGSNAWNAPRTFVRCPAGHLVELMSAPPYPPWPGEE